MEQFIINWAKNAELNFLNCACRFTEGVSKKEEDSKRIEMKNLIKNMKKNNPNVDDNLFKSIDNVNINCILGYTKNKERHSFLDEYER